MNFNRISFPINLISKYRTELMGVAIFGVMWGHFMNETWQPVVLSQLARLIHTAGFIFLSGFGLYYGYEKYADIKSFYKKRLIRIFGSYIVCTYWFFIIALACGKDSLLKFFTNLTATTFWFYEDAHWSMWYISAIILLYLLFPLLYHFLFSIKQTMYGLLGIFTFYICLLITIAHFFPYYWTYTSIFFVRFIMFPLGMYVAYLSKNAKEISLKQLILYFITCAALLVIAKLWIDDEVYAVIRTLIGLPLITIALYYINRIKSAQSIIFLPLQFLGKHSLELYLIHITVFYFLHNIVGIQSAISMIIGIIVALLLCKPVHNGINHLILSKK